MPQAELRTNGRNSILRIAKSVSLPSLAIFLASCGGGAGQNDNGAFDGVPPVASWELVWSDEFDGVVDESGNLMLDESKWEVELGDGKAEGLTRWGNGELQYYSEDNISIVDGNLVINSRVEEVEVMDAADPVANVGVYDYTSGRIRTQGRFDFTYGRIEARIKMPESQGIWSAFWLLGTDPSPYGTWAAKGEIDIVETYARGTGFSPVPFASSAIHFGGPFPFNVFDTKSTADFEEEAQTQGLNANADPFPGPGFDFFSDYHIYSVEWDDEQIRFYIDGVNYYSVKATNFYSYFTDADFSTPSGPTDTFKYSSDPAEGKLGFQAAAGADAPFDSLFHIILNSAVGGSLPNALGEPPSEAEIGVAGDDMLVDYVRVYRCNQADLITGLGGVACKNTANRTGVVLPEDPDNPGETILPNFTSNNLAATSTVYNLFTSEFDIFVDGPGLESDVNTPEFAIEEFNGGQATEVTDPGTGNTYIQFDFAPGSSGVTGIAITDASGEDLVLSGISPGLGDIKFDLYVEEFLADGVTPVDLSGKFLRIGIASQATTRFLVIPLTDVGFNTWRRYHIPLQYLVSNGGGGNGFDPSAVSRLIEFVVGAGEVNLRLDNIGFACGGQPCGVVGEVNVFVDDIDPIWDRGIVGDDSFQRFTGNGGVPNPDYTDNDCCHVQWDLVELGAGELDFDGQPRGTVVETRFGTTGTDGAVNFVGSTQPFPSIAALRDGEFSFDIRVTRNDDNPPGAQLLFKIDANGGPGQFSSTGEQPLGDLPLNTWRRFTCPIQTLEAQGLDTSQITAPFVLVPGNRGGAQGITVQWDNVRFSTERSGSPTTFVLADFSPIVFDSVPGFCLPIAPFNGGAFAIIDNPDTSGLNPNSRVGQTRKFDIGNSNGVFGGITLNLTSPIMFGDVTDPTDKQFRIWTYAERVGLPVTFKLESIFGQANSPGRVFETTVANAWEEHVIDFNGLSANEFSGITVILDDGVSGDGSDDFRLEFDNLRIEPATSTIADLIDVATTPAIVPVVYNFDEPGLVYPLSPFSEARASVESDGPAGSSGNIAAVFLPDFSAPFSGVTLGGGTGFPTAIPFAPGRTTLEVDVWVPDANTPVEIKIEDATDSFQVDSDTQIAPSVGWNTLQFDFSDIVDPMTGMLFDEIDPDTMLPTGNKQTFEKVVIIFEPNTTRTNKTFYFDNVQLLAP